MPVDWKDATIEWWTSLSALIMTLIMLKHRALPALHTIPIINSEEETLVWSYLLERLTMKMTAANETIMFTNSKGLSFSFNV